MNYSSDGGLERMYASMFLSLSLFFSLTRSRMKMQVSEALRGCMHLCAHAKLILCTALQLCSNYNFNY